MRAREHKRRAGHRAANLQSLADAATAISSFAGLLRDARMTGRELDDVVTPAMWDQYKFASDAFILECRDALATSP